MIKQLFLFFLCLFLTNLSSAYEGFHCVRSLRESRIQVLVQNNEVQVLVVNPMGYEFMPQFDGPSSVFNLSFNKMQGDDLKGLGDHFTFSWPKDSCKLDTTNFTISCTAEAKNSMNSVKSYGLTTTEVTEKYENEKYEKRKFRFSFEKDNLYFVTLQFDTKSCERFN